MANFIEINHPDYCEVLTFDNFWLRDHCRCELCYNSETKQRQYNLLTIPLNIKPVSTKLLNGSLHVKWDDDHESYYNLNFLYQAQFSTLLRNFDVIEKTLWDRESIEKLNYARVTLTDLLSNSDVVQNVVSSLVQFGFAFVDNVPPNTDMTEMTVRRMFPVQKTFFGEMWSFTDIKDHADTAYSKQYLGPHTDNTYFNDAAGLQVLHCIHHNGCGGETLLFDGFKILNDLKNEDLQAYKKLCKVNIPAEYVENGVHYTYSAPIIRLNSITEEPEQIRYNLYDRAAFNSIPQAEMTDFYSSLRNLIKIVEREQNMWKFKLEPGTVLFFDNWRLLHGRESYTGTRQMTGCYVSRADFMSKARVLNLIN